MLENIKRSATATTPNVEFNFSNNHFVLSGEMFPENTRPFYEEAIKPVLKHLRTMVEQEILFELKLTYYNSSSAKILFEMIEELDTAAGRGNRVQIKWWHAEDDDNMQEFGEEFSEDVVHASFEIAVL
ncbi:MAG: DUF1987 domain-containing protein [Gimesia sp.]|nr:DUF1987 domain-containing protein [Gimesia sp.]